MTTINPFARKAKPTTLAEQLAAKSDQLRQTQASKAVAAEDLLAAAAAAQTVSRTAAAQATAVEEAFDIITAAGVTL